MMKFLRSAIPWLVFLYAMATLVSMAGMEIFGWLLFVATIILVILDKEKKWLRRPIFDLADKLVLGLFGAIVLSATFSPIEGIDRAFVIGNGRFVFLFIATRIAFESLSQEQISRGIKILLPIVGIISVYAVSQFFTGYDVVRGQRFESFSPGYEVYRAGGMWGTPMTFAHSMALSFFFAFSIALVGSPEKAWVRKVAIVVATLSGLSLLTSFTRGAWLGVAAGVLVTTFYISRKLALVATGGLLAILVVASMVSTHIRERVVSIVSLEKSSNTIRIDLWKANFEMFKDHPLLGVGYGINEDIVGSYFQKMGIVQEFNGHAHNNYLQFLAGTGIVGFSLFLAFSFVVLRYAHRLLLRREKSPSWRTVIAMAAMGAMVALHVGGWTECNFKDAEVNHQYMMILALLVAVWRQRDTTFASSGEKD